MKISLSEAEKAKFRRWAKSMSKENKALCQKNIVRATEMIVRYAKMNAPVSSNKKKYQKTGGRLRSSIQSSYTNDRLGSQVTVNALYGPYMEFGTGKYVSVPNGYEDYAMQFKGLGIREVNIHAKPFLIRAYERANKALINEFKKQGFKDEGSE